MSQKFPLKGVPTGTGSNVKLAEFAAGDFVGIDDGGTGAIDVPGAQTNLEIIPAPTKGQPNGVCPLDGSNLVPEVHLPDIVKPQVHNVADDTARAALVAQEGDEAIQANDNSHWIFNGAAWVERPGQKVLLRDGVTLIRIKRE